MGFSIVGKAACPSLVGPLPPLPDPSQAAAAFARLVDEPTCSHCGDPLDGPDVDCEACADDD
jgi:hypothetical protein